MSASRAEKSNGSSLAASFAGGCLSSRAALPPFLCRRGVAESQRCGLRKRGSAVRWIGKALVRVRMLSGRVREVKALSQKSFLYGVNASISARRIV